MNKTRFSLFYLASYLIGGGLGLLAAPQTMLTLFFSNGHYRDVLVRLVGVLLLALGIIVVQIIRFRIAQLYPTTLIVRTIILIVLALLYISSRDPMMITLFVIVGFGFLLTLGGYMADQGGSGCK